MTIQVNSPRLHDVVDPEAEVEQVATGFEFTEGPVWNGIEGFLLFSDVSGDVTVRWSEDDGATDWRRPSGHANGLVYDADHRLVACEHDRSVVTRTELDGSVSVVASHYDGKELNSPNDVCVSSDGAVWFTDPHPSGRTADWGIERDAELDFRGVFRITPGAAEPALLTAELDFPNGLCLSPDERRLYVNDSWRMQIRVFDVRPDGSIENNRLVLTEPGPGTFQDGIPDGMKCDEHRQPLLHRAGRRLGHLVRGRAPRHDRDPRTSLQHGLRRAGLVDALRHRDSFRLPRATASAERPASARALDRRGTAQASSCSTRATISWSDAISESVQWRGPGAW